MIDERMAVAQIVLDHSETAAVFKKHRIDYCCKGELPLEDAARERGLEPAAVLQELQRAVAARNAAADSVDLRGVGTTELVAHIVERHHKYLRDVLPFLVALANKVARVHGPHNPKLIDVRDSVAELAELLVPHLDQEEQVLFPALTEPTAEKAEVVRNELSTMRQDHLQVANVLTNLRDAADDFTVPEWGCTSYNTLFRELTALEADVFQHVHVENHVLLPRFAQAA